MSFVQSAEFRRLYSRHFRLVWSVVGQLGMHGAAREDAAQEIWIVVVRRLHTLDPEASERAWLCAIAKKVVWRLRRNTQRFDARVAAFAHTPQCSPADASTRYEAASTAAEALRSLSDAQRSVLVLTLVHGFTAPEVSDALGLPLNTVYSRLRLARQRLAAFDVKRRALEEALDSTEQPPAGVRQRVLSAVLPWVPAPWFAASTLKAFALGGVLGGALVIAGGATLDPPQPVRRAAVVTPDGPQTASAAATPSVSSSRPGPPAAPEQEPAQMPTSPPRRSSRADSPAVSVDTGTPAKAPLLDDESRLLAAAQRALRGDEPQQALRLLRQHELQFAQGRLVEVREGALVRALCALGRTADAASARRRLASQRPGSAIATAVEDVCATRTDGSRTPRR